MNSRRTEGIKMSNKPGKRKINKNALGRLVKMLFKFYPVLVPLALFCIIFSAVASAIPAIFLQKVTEAVEIWQASGDWALASKEILPDVLVLVVFYVLSIITITLDTQLTAYITQGFLCKMRRGMFDGMQDLPIRYFDTHKHGDIMSYYTNDIDALRQLVSQSLPTLVRASIIVLSVLGIMLWYSIWLTLILLVGVVAMMLVSKKIGGGSSKYFIRQQNSIGRTEGFAQEMMRSEEHTSELQSRE